MNNQQLMELFQEIEKGGNCFDCAMALKKANKQYKKSEFYKQTRFPIAKAFKLYQYNSIMSLGQFLNSPMMQTLLKGDSLLFRLYIQNFLADFDTTALEPIFNFIEDKINNFDVIDGAEIVELKNVIKGFLSSIAK